MSKIEKHDLINTLKCQAIGWSEYQSRRWSYATHLSGYHIDMTQKINREVGKVELWMRLNVNHSILFDWYFDRQRKIGDVIRIPSVEYTHGISMLHANFANCPIFQSIRSRLDLFTLLWGLLTLIYC